MPMVRMKGDTRLKAISTPLASPIAVPTSSVVTTAEGMLAESPAMSTAETTAVREMTAPTDRSTPPAIITAVTPTAAMPTGAAWRMMLSR